MVSSGIIYARVMHIAAAIYNLLFVYTPLHEWSYGFALVQYVSMPLLIISGLILVRIRKSKSL